MRSDPVAVVQAVLANPTDLAHVRTLTTPDVKYISLNDDDPDLHRVMPWSGVGHGAEAIVRAFGLVGRAWEVIAFTPEQVFGSGPHVAIFGHFTYRSRRLGKLVSTPFAIRCEVVEGRVSVMQFMEDTFATAASFRAGGEWRFQTYPDTHPDEAAEVRVGNGAP